MGMSEASEIKQCKCGYNFIVYSIEYRFDKSDSYRFFDGNSGNYEQTYVCPGCHDRLDYSTLEG